MDEELLKKKPPYARGGKIQSVRCLDCNTENEEFKPICYACGATLQQGQRGVFSSVPEVQYQDPDKIVGKAIGQGVLIFILLWAGGIGLLCMFLHNLFN